MAKPSHSRSSSSSPLFEILYEESFPELPESLEDRCVELEIVLRSQPLSSRPLPTFDTGSSGDLGLESPNNPVQTLENSSNTDGQLGLVLYPINHLFDPIAISPQGPYSPYNQPGVPLELSSHTSLAIHHRLFPNMELKFDALVTSLEESEFSTPHTVEEKALHFPPEGFPNSGGIHASLPPNYVSLAQLVLGTPSASSLYHNPVWVSSAMHTSGLFVVNMTSQQAVTSIPVQPIILNTLVSSIPVTRQAQPVVSKNVSVSSSIPLVSGQVVPLPGMEPELFYGVMYHQCEWLTSSHVWNEPSFFWYYSQTC